MHNRTIRARLTFGFGAVLAITTVLGLFLLAGLSTIGRSASAISRNSLPATEATAQIESYVRQNQVFTLRHILAESAAEMAALEEQMKAITVANDQAYAEYEKAVSRPRDRELFDDLVPARKEYINLRRELLDISRRKAGTTQESLDFYQTRLLPAMERYITRIAAARQESRQYAHANSDSIARSLGWARGGILVGIIGVIAVGCVLAWFIVSSVAKVLRKSVAELATGAEQVASAAAQVASSAQSLSQGASTQGATLQETSASMEEVANMTRRNADDSHEAAATMESTDKAVQDANIALHEMVSSMAAIGASSQKVSGIIRTIDEIAFQTNILALNAAVEAARAGEAGAGFAIVADEVRGLAQRSAQAARDTADLIEESIAKAGEGHKRVGQVSSAIQAIGSSATVVKRLVDSVSTASKQQSRGIEHVSTAVTQLERVAHTTAAVAEESAAASEELSAQVETVIHVVGRLAELVDGNRQGRSQSRLSRTIGSVAAARRAGRYDAAVTALNTSPSTNA